ncbi:ABC transporter permease subunit [Luteolibacter sp. GHJ8]|uniref:ABC transporter permease subunit n=1 Tax=Luteolibacter rhizosphaerae TaxID=2989719 RepID=A0ABT3G834_9BACT|nr:ABC transporter permease subunit [Luteolibacter rhizosphaerae]MCW1916016.1 ABC transporter permease subunit [Luteolibacter rhizosphaerae]
MTFPRKIGILLLLLAAAAYAGHEAGLSLPSLRWFFSFDSAPGAFPEDHWRAEQGRWIGYGFCGLMALTGLLLLAMGGGFQWNPLTVRKFSRFRSIGRGWLSFRLLMLLLLLTLLDQVVAGRQALAVKYDGKWFFPAFREAAFAAKDFGGEGDQEADYRQLKADFKERKSGNFVIMPLIPWEPVLDSDELQKRPLDNLDGKIHRAGDNQPFNGYAVQFWPESPEVKLRDARFRGGLREGPATLFDGKGEFAGKQTWHQGELVETSVPDEGPPPGDLRWVEIIYKPAPPSLAEQHYLGTDSNGWDIAAQLFGGLQVIFKAAFVYILLTYGIGITIGSMMGYFGGAFDLIMDRFVEILSNVPFLLVVIIITANIGRDNIDLATILLVFCVFSWIGVSVYLRTATYREKARDYVAAARVQGAGTFRVVFRHILPNAISTIVTLLPFSVAALATSLTALDFLGFGLPDRYPSWGRVLEDGTSNLSSTWIVSSVFAVMVGVLLLITFVGEAIREAFDPKKFTTYQ